MIPGCPISTHVRMGKSTWQLSWLWWRHAPGGRFNYSAPLVNRTMPNHDDVANLVLRALSD